MSSEGEVVGDGLRSGALIRLLAGTHRGQTLLGFGSGAQLLMGVFEPVLGRGVWMVEPGETVRVLRRSTEVISGSEWADIPLPPRSVGLCLLPPPVQWPSDPVACRHWLEAVFSCLSDDGELLCLAPSRWSLRYLRQWLAGEKPARCHTPWGYRRRLDRSGFHAVECYSVRRDAAHLVIELAPHDSASIPWCRPLPRDFKGKFKRCFGLTNELGIRAARRQLPKSTLELVFEAVSSQLVTRGLRVHGVHASAKAKAFVFLEGGDGSWVVRMPLDEGAMVASHHHKLMLESVRQRVGPVGWLPETVASGEAGGSHYDVETAVRGQPMKRVYRTIVQPGYLPQIESLLYQLNRREDQPASVVLEGYLFREMVSAPLERIWVDVGEAAPLLREQVQSFLGRYLYKLSFIPGIIHGDFSLSNIFVEQGQISGVIDWDDARERGVPVLDGINHLVSLELFRRSGQSYGDVLYRLAFEEWPVPEEWEFLERLYQFSGVDSARHPGLVYLNWLNTAETRLQDASAVTPLLVQRYLTDVVGRLSDSGQLS